MGECVESLESISVRKDYQPENSKDWPIFCTECHRAHRIRSHSIVTSDSPATHLLLFNNLLLLPNITQQNLKNYLSLLNCGENENIY